MTTRKLLFLPLILATAFAVAGCGGSSDGDAPTPPAPPPPPPQLGESFTTWSKNGVFAKDADGDPEIMDELVFNFDGNDNPDAYADLLPPTGS